MKSLKLYLLISTLFLINDIRAQEVVILNSKSNRFLINEKSDKPRLDIIVQKFTDYEKNVIAKSAVMDTVTKPKFEKVSENEYNISASRMGEKLTFVARNYEKLDKGVYFCRTPSDEHGDSLFLLSQIQLVNKLNGEQTIALPPIPFLFQQGKILLMDSNKNIVFKLNIKFSYVKPELIYVDITDGFGNKSWDDTSQIRKIVNRVNQVPTVYSQNNAVPDSIVTSYDNLFFRFKKAYYDGKLKETALFCKIDDKFWTKTQLEMYPTSDVESLGEKTSWYILPSGEHTVTAGYVPGGDLEIYRFVMNQGWQKSALYYLTQAVNLLMMILYMHPWILLILIGLIIFANWGNRIKKEREAAKKTNLELQSIQAQLNPHFVFNALGSVQGLINKNEIEKANIYLGDFSKLLRNSLNNNGKETVPLSVELHTLDSYIKLEQLRFNFKYRIDVDESVGNAQIEIPSLLIQPLVENAIKHGMSALGEDGFLQISFTKSGNDLLIDIKDNGKGFDVQQQVQGQGIKLTKERIKLLNKQKRKIVLDIRSTPENGTQAQIILKDTF